MIMTRIQTGQPDITTPIFSSKPLLLTSRAWRTGRQMGQDKAKDEMHSGWGMGRQLRPLVLAWGLRGRDMTKVIVEKRQPRRFFVEGCGGSRVPARAKWLLWSEGQSVFLGFSLTSPPRGSTLVTATEKSMLLALLVSGVVDQWQRRYKPQLPPSTKSIGGSQKLKDWWRLI